MRTLIENGHLLTMSGPRTVVDKGAVLIEDDRIAWVGPTTELGEQRETADRVIDASGSAILPGFVNTHTHLAGAITKALTEDAVAFGGPFKIALGMHENVVRKEDVYLPGMVHGMEMLKTGTTTINECWWHQPESARIIVDIGLRGVVGAEIREVDTSKIGFGRFDRDWDQDLLEAGFDEAQELFENWHGKANGRITCRVAPDGPDRLRPESLGRLGELAKKHGVGVHTHLCSVPGEAEFMEKLWGKKSIPLLKELGLLGPRFIGAHCVYVDDDDIATMVETGSCMAHTSYLCAKRGYYPPMDKIYDAGMNVALASDWLSNDMFTIMRCAVIVPRALFGKTAIRTGWDVLEMATIGGAKCLGMDDTIGSLGPGKKADVIVVDMATSWCSPLRLDNIVTDLVFNAQGGDVTHVFVDGTLLVEDKRMTDVDERALIREAQQAAEGVWARAGNLFAEAGV